MGNKALCNNDCNHCPIITHPNSRMVSLILNAMYNKFGTEAYHIVQSHCPNLTCCFDCHIDDFCHMGNCDIINTLNQEMPNGE
jgi:hypothetical protein